ncbi:MAG: glycosyltransferase [Dehalococcoidales bacterium]|nr:glycosyltransferase [Dehalococcoidales bacterium]
MKILQVIPYYYPAFAYGGPPKIAFEFSRKLADRGHQVTVYATDALNNKQRIRNGSNPINLEGVRTYYFKNLSNKLAWNYKIFLSPGMIPQAGKEIGEFDIINLYEFRTLQNAVIHYYARKYHKPYTLSAWGSVMPIGTRLGQKKIFDYLIGFRILRDAACVIAGTSYEENEYRQMGVDDKRIVRVPMSCDLEPFLNLPVRGLFKEKYGLKDRNIILFLGRINRIKGIEFLIRAYHKVAYQREDTILVIAGPDDGEKANLEKLINSLNLNERVLFTGFLDGEEKKCALVDASMLVQTSLFERGPGSPFEAILCNTPIIVTRDTGAGELISEIDAGYLVKYGDVPDLVQKIIRILDDPADALSKTFRARQYIFKHCSWESVVTQYEILFEDLIRKWKKD